MQPDKIKVRLLSYIIILNPIFEIELLYVEDSTWLPFGFVLQIPVLVCLGEKPPQGRPSHRKTSMDGKTRLLNPIN
jgi:hypothetical protein